MQALCGVHAALVRFYDPHNARKLLSEPHSRNAELYPVFVPVFVPVFGGDDVEFFIGGEVARLPDVRPRLHELRTPLLILAGRYGRALYPSYQAELKQYAPRAELVMMERSGTFSHVDGGGGGHGA